MGQSFFYLLLRYMADVFPKAMRGFVFFFFFLLCLNFPCFVAFEMNHVPEVTLVWVVWKGLENEMMYVSFWDWSF